MALGLALPRSHPEHVQTRAGGPPHVCDLVGLGRARERACLTSPGDADAVGPGATLENHGATAEVGSPLL